MAEIYINIDALEPSAASPNQPGLLGPRAKGTGRRIWVPAVVCLGLLCAALLARLVLLGVQHSVTVKDLSVTQSELTERQKELSTLEEERSQLNSSLFSLKQRFDERLKENIRRSQTCPEGWRKFENACYHHSAQRKSWDNSRKDCMAKGGDLVVIESSQEQTFLSEYIRGHSWIGLTDLEQEGTWKWVNGAPLVLSGWGKNQPDNSGNEDCGHIGDKSYWNDLPCHLPRQWICEAPAEDA